MNLRRMLGLETDEERTIANWAFVILAFLWSAWGTLTEVRYLLAGRTAVAKVDARIGTRGQRVGKLKFRYWSESAERDYTGRVPHAYEKHVGSDQSIEIEYLSGGKARVRGQHEWVAIGLFLVFGSIMTMYLIPIVREAKGG